MNTEVTLKDYLIYWFEEVFSPRVESTTRMVAAYAIYDLILPKIEYDIMVRYVNVEYLDSLLVNVAKACPSAGNKGREILNLVLKEAVVAGYLKTNPVPGTKTYKRAKPSITILSRDKIKVLLKAASLSNWYLEILLGLFCGLRKVEIMGLKFGDFDFEKNTVYINRQIASDPIIKKGGYKIDEYGLVERDPKTPNSFRTLRVPEVVMQEVKKRRQMVECNKVKHAEDYRDRDYISCQENGMLHSMAALNSALTKICSRNGLPHVTPHGLRHTFEYYCDVMDETENILAFMNQAFVPVGA